MALGTIVELAIDGVARGLLFALLGASITLVFGLGNVLNISLGVFAVVAVIASTEVASAVPVGGSAGGAVVGLAVVAALGLAVDRTLLSSVYRSEGDERIVLGIFVTLGLALFLEGLLFVYYPLSYALPHSVAALEVAGIRVRGSRLIVLGAASLVLAGLFLFLDRTYFGKATRTVFQDETGALLCGIDPRRIRTLVFVLSVVLAGVAGILRSLQSEVSAAAAFELTVFAIIVSIVGGVRNVRGTVAAGVLLGLVITFANFYIGAYVSRVLLFAVAVGVLILRPEEIA
jgi:branched-chain amino acid transport system permease protein